MAVDAVTVTILGATGSIGTSALDVMARHPGRFRVRALTGHRNIGLLAQQCRRFRPELAVVADAQAASALREQLGAACGDIQILYGEDGLEYAAGSGADITVAAIVGAAGLRPALRAVADGGRILLANKESLVMAGALFMDAVARSGATLLPLDSEHNAVFQCLPGNFSRARPVDSGVTRVLLTASGGPFRATPRSELEQVTPEQACAHPNWSMGRKISVDSATLMNKGLEVIEASWLFGIDADHLDVVVHPQSIVHSLVEYVDGTMLAQMSNPDMRTPIAHALGWPERLEAGVTPLDLVGLGRLDFGAPDHDRFPCLGLAYQALRAGGSAPAVLNAANEEAVSAFLDQCLPFTGIATVIETALECAETVDLTGIDALLAVDGAARRVARDAIARAGAAQ
ncbi:1-deoxy-D-xylulose-5-phosphate reductoisomerase [Aquisalimonas asiatica]|uniref:1-deoxy-D-xylulose 5-phosphate reductoisomerase n=1 Tax=Aquisalimonas asiatica TaxID=406100 RepID=A0A1H8QK99_9GAMM|nr:1-deoxy-D-xylulose-5-phosphate reductoisomerase [Aquisalimonas asiatica]SEO54448.1 1-deoxy-D-xylulose 5-phosphate reductoisomerase [Aquisalimonas asiatica]